MLKFYHDNLITYKKFDEMIREVWQKHLLFRQRLSLYFDNFLIWFLTKNVYKNKRMDK